MESLLDMLFVVRLDDGRLGDFPLSLTNWNIVIANQIFACSIKYFKQNKIFDFIEIMDELALELKAYYYLLLSDPSYLNHHELL